MLGMSLNYNLIDNKNDKFSFTFTYENDLIPLSYNDLSIRNYMFQFKFGYKLSNRRLWKFQRFL